MMTQNEIHKLVSLFRQCGYTDANKKDFKRLSHKLLKELRETLGIYADVRYNAGGIAVSGDATMHGDRIYVTFNMDMCDWILYRKCNGRKDYTGGTNRQFSFSRLEKEGIAGLAKAISIEMNSQDLTKS